ncbi:MAG: hypothetical protein ACXADC_14340 [Candidatus Thorarchaeota archaeon]
MAIIYQAKEERGSTLTSSKSPRGIEILADLEILVGIGSIVFGIFLILYIDISGVIALLGGGLLIAMGWALHKLEPWAWWGSLIVNVVLCVGHIAFAGNYLLFILSFSFIVYLLTPGVRSRFFQ